MTEPVTAGLADTIAALRSELAAAMAEGKDKDLHFELGEVGVEFQVVVSRDVSADGGIRFGVVSFGGKGSLGDEGTHRISLTLQPISGGKRAEIGKRGGGAPR